MALFREAGAAPDAFFLRTTRYMRRMENYLREWNVNGARASSLARIRAEVVAVCDAMADGGPSRTNCRTFLARPSQTPESPDSPDPSI